MHIETIFRGGKSSKITAVDVVEHITLNCFIVSTARSQFYSPASPSSKALFMLLTFLLEVGYFCFFYSSLLTFCCGDENDS